LVSESLDVVALKKWFKQVDHRRSTEALVFTPSALIVNVIEVCTKQQ